MFSTIFISAMMMLNAPADNTVISANEFVIESTAQGVVFRSTQKLRSNDGRSIYLYTNGNCELFDGDRLITACQYNVQNGEVRLLDENGYTTYKGTYTMKSDGRNLATITLQGTIFRAF